MSRQFDTGAIPTPVLDGYPVILRTLAVLELTGLSRTSLWRRIRDGDFPAAVRLGGPNSRAVGWRRSEIEQWLEERPRA